MQPASICYTILLMAGLHVARMHTDTQFTKDFSGYIYFFVYSETFEFVVVLGRSLRVEIVMISFVLYNPFSFQVVLVCLICVYYII